MIQENHVDQVDEAGDVQEAVIQQFWGIRLASQICGTPIAAVSLVDANRQWFSAVHGLPVRETPREVCFCAHTILQDGPLVVPDATKDERFASSSLVTGDPSIRFYAGVRLMTDDDLPLGSLCVIDSTPRTLDAGQLESLKTLGSLLAGQLELHRRNRQLLDAKHAQHEIADRLNKLASRVPGAIYQFRQRPDGTFCFPYSSEGIRLINNVTPEQVRDDASAAFAGLHPDDLPAVVASIKESHETLVQWRQEFRVRHADGTERWLLGNSVPEREADGGTLWHGVMTDITRSKQAETALAKVNVELEKARMQAEAANRAKSAFLANMSHEIRTPLTAILGFAELLREEGQLADAPPKRVLAIDTIHRAGSHLLSLINDILDLSKIEAEKMTVERIEMSPLNVLAEVRDLLAPIARGKGVKLEVAFASPVPERIMGDPTRLRQVLMNLVGNAVKFTEAGRVSIVVGASVIDGASRLTFEVDDTGAGMSQEQAQHLFHAFGQADESVTRKHGGTGLGLMVSRRLAALMGGTVELLSTTPGKGSTFQFVLPLEAAPDAAMVAKLQNTEHQVSPAEVGVKLTGRILLAEDGPDNQRLIAFHLHKAGATVEIANNGRIALEMIEKAAASTLPFDILLTDIQMPEMDGYALARILRERGCTLPIVALTAHAMAEDRSRCIESGCNDYASKPVDKVALLQTCSRWMNVARGAQPHPKAA